ncbi:retrotransposon protein, putative, ty1-copia subclass [Tanacetum coccineum]
MSLLFKRQFEIIHPKTCGLTSKNVEKTSRCRNLRSGGWLTCCRRPLVLNKDFGFCKNFNCIARGRQLKLELHAMLIDFDKLVTTAKLLGIGRGTVLFISKSCMQNKKKSEPGAAVSGYKATPHPKKETILWNQYLQVGNGTQAAVEAIGMFDLVLPSGLVLKLNNCYYAPSIVRGVVSLSYLPILAKDSACKILHRKVFKAEVELQIGKKIKALRFDRGGKYLSQEFKDYLSENGIVQNLTSPYTPSNKMVYLRRNRTYWLWCRSMFNLTTLPLSFWDYALESVVRILNMVPTKKVDKTPYEIWHGKAPNLSYLKVWGCEAYVKRDSADKLQQRSVKCIFVGYPKETMGYYFYFPPENKVIVARYGDFLERDLISQEFSGRDYDLEDDHMDTLPSENTSEILVEPESLGPPSELIPASV